MAVRTLPELHDEIANGNTGDTIRLVRGFQADITNETFHNLPHDVTLISGTSADGEPTATFFDANRGRAESVFEAFGAATIRGIEAIGPVHDVVADTPDVTHAPFLELHGPKARIGRCRLSGYPAGNVQLGSADIETDAIVENTQSTHSLMQGLGYGVKQNNGKLEVRNSYIDYCRHGVSSFGRPTCNLYSHDNVYGEHFISHAFDVHNWKLDNHGQEDVAGGTIEVHDDVFQLDRNFNNGQPQEGIVIRGAPADHCEIWRCVFAQDHEPSNPGTQGDAYRQSNVDQWTNFEAHDNSFGGVGRPPGGRFGLVMALGLSGLVGLAWAGR